MNDDILQPAEGAEPLYEPAETEPSVSESAAPTAEVPAAEMQEASPSREEEAAALQAEINRLREELAGRDAFYERMARESEELYSLYPEADPHTLPDSVWEDVRRGIPIAAAYALSERRRACEAQKAEEANRNNSRRSSGAIEATAQEYYSPGEVRSMSASEVRKNYTNIMRSMQKWH